MLLRRSTHHPLLLPLGARGLELLLGLLLLRLLTRRVVLGHLAVVDLHNLAHVETVHVVQVGEVAAGLGHVGVEAVLADLLEAGAAEDKIGLDDLNTAALQSIVRDALVLVDEHRTRGVDYGAADLAAVDGIEEQLLLDLCAVRNVVLRLVRLDGLVTRNDASATAGRVKQNAVEEICVHLAVLAAVDVCHHNTVAPHALDVREESLAAGSGDIVGEDDTGVLHQGADVRRLATGGGGEVQHLLPGLWVQRDHREERHGGLDHVVPRKVLKRGTNGNLGVEDLHANVAPLLQCLNVHTARGEGLRKVAALCLECVHTQRQRAVAFVGLDELNHLFRGKHVEELAHEEVVVVVQTHQVALQKANVLWALRALLTLLFEVLQHAHNLSHTVTDVLHVVVFVLFECRLCGTLRTRPVLLEVGLVIVLLLLHHFLMELGGLILEGFVFLLLVVLELHFLIVQRVFVVAVLDVVSGHKVRHDLFEVVVIFLDSTAAAFRGLLLLRFGGRGGTLSSP
eukprot:PhM_4_TR7342/c0_g1_i1/m.46990